MCIYFCVYSAKWYFGETLQSTVISNEYYGIYIVYCVKTMSLILHDC